MVLPIEYEYSIWVGEDGFGDAHLPIISPILEPEHAVSAIIRLAEEYKGKLTILSIAPLTNLAMAVRLKPDLKNMIKSVYILGGNHQGNFHFIPTFFYLFIVKNKRCACV